MCFEIKLYELLKKNGDISKEIVDLIDMYDCDGYTIKLSTDIQQKIMKRLINEQQQEEVWDRILSVLSSGEISDEIIEYLIENKISLLSLCHMELSDKWLLKLVVYDDAPLYTVAKRYFSLDKYSAYQFVEFYFSYLYKYDYISTYLLENYKASSKRELLMYLCFNNSSYREIEALNQQMLIDKIKTITNPEEISCLYEMYSEAGDILLIIAQNYFTPKEILEKLCFVKNVKYASKIRMLSKESLAIIELTQCKTGDGSLS